MCVTFIIICEYPLNSYQRKKKTIDNITDYVGGDISTTNNVGAIESEHKEEGDTANLFKKEGLFI